MMRREVSGMKNKLVPFKRSRNDVVMSRPGDPFDLLHREINSLFDSFSLSRWGDWSRQEAEGFELSETEDEIQVKAELPGMDEKDVDVLLDENTLIIRGEHKEKRESKKRKRHVSEMSYGRFHRSILLPAEVDAARAKAKFKRGVLTLAFPKTERAKRNSRRIPVHTG
jgi:HSP20 family protein